MTTSGSGTIPPDDPGQQYATWGLIAADETNGAPKFEWYQLGQGNLEECRAIQRQAFDQGFAFIEDGQEFLAVVVNSYVKPQ